MSAESSAAIIRRMADADNAASMRRLEADLREACELLARAAAALEPHVMQDQDAWDATCAIRVWLVARSAPVEWRRGAKAEPGECYRGC